MEYYAAIKRNGTLRQTTKWTNLQNIMPSERSQIPSMIPSIMKCPEQANPERQKADEWLQEAGEEGIGTDC